MKLFKRFQPEVLDKWHAFFDNFQMPCDDFYNQVKEELEARKVPGLKISNVAWNEGGILSHERKYLRLTRERWVFDICAAPFGRGYLFSYRFTELPIKISMLALALVMFCVFAIPIGIYSGLRAELGAAPSFLITFIIVCLVPIVMSIKHATGSADIDSMFLQAPGIGPFYEKYFRKNTYYREDTRLMYLATVPAIVKTLTEQVTVKDGVKQRAALDVKPVMPELAGLT